METNMIRITEEEWNNIISNMQVGMENLTLTGSSIKGFLQIHHGSVVIGHHQFKGVFYFEMDENMYNKYNK